MTQFEKKFSNSRDESSERKKVFRYRQKRQHEELSASAEV